jgi:hypothetical protein
MSGLIYFFFKSKELFLGEEGKRVIPPLSKGGFFFLVDWDK